MGFLNRKTVKSNKYIQDTAQPTTIINDDFQADFSTEPRSLRSIAFEVLQNVPFSVQTLMDMVIGQNDEEPYREFGIESITKVLSRIEKGIREKSVTQDKLNEYLMIKLLFILGAEIKIHGTECVYRTPSNRRRVNMILASNRLFNNVIEKVAFIEYVENGEDILNELEDKQFGGSLYVKDICELVKHYRLVTYKDFELKLA